MKDPISCASYVEVAVYNPFVVRHQLMESGSAVNCICLKADQSFTNCLNSVSEFILRSPRIHIPFVKARWTLRFFREAILKHKGSQARVLNYRATIYGGYFFLQVFCLCPATSNCDVLAGPPVRAGPSSNGQVLERCLEYVGYIIGVVERN